MSLFHLIDHGTPDKLNVIVENPKGVMGKYEMDHETGAIFVDRVSYAPMPFPFEYGFVPQSWNIDDGDPLDVMVWSSFPTFPGCVFPARVIGVLDLTDTGEKDYKILALPHEDARFGHIETLEQFPDFLKKEIEYFWTHYKKLQPGKHVEIVGWKGKDEAIKLLDASFAEYEKKYGDDAFGSACACGGNCGCNTEEEK